MGKELLNLHEFVKLLESRGIKLIGIKHKEIEKHQKVVGKLMNGQDKVETTPFTIDSFAKFSLGFRFEVIDAIRLENETRLKEA